MRAAAVVSTAAMRGISNPAVAAFRRRQRQLRPETLLDVERNWRALPAVEQLSLDIRSDRQSLHICDIRVTAENVTRQSYFGSYDPALFLMTTSLDLQPRRCSWATTAQLTVILHGVGRRFERSDPSDIGDEAILRDLRYLAAALPELTALSDGEAFTVPTKFGAWRGEVAPIVTPGDDMRSCIHVRTYVD
jgi:hypothetical protein